MLYYSLVTNICPFSQIEFVLIYLTFWKKLEAFVTLSKLTLIISVSGMLINRQVFNGEITCYLDKYSMIRLLNIFVRTSQNLSLKRQIQGCQSLDSWPHLVSLFNKIRYSLWVMTKMIMSTYYYFIYKLILAMI